MEDKHEGKYRTLSSTTIIERPWLTARRDEVELPDGRVNHEYYVLHYPDFVNVIALKSDGRMLLERQYRYALGRECPEICAGVMEKGETPLFAAKRELMEETGHGGGTWEELMTTSPNSSTCDNVCHSFLARGVEIMGEQHLDDTESLVVTEKSQEEVFAMLMRGEFMQAMMIAPLWKYFAIYRPDLVKGASAFSAGGKP